MPATLKKLQDETRKVIIALDAIAAAPTDRRMSFTDAYHGGFATSGGVNFSLAACDAAAAITGHDRTLCRMFNHRFRHDAARLLMERALAA